MKRKSLLAGLLLVLIQVVNAQNLTINAESDQVTIKLDNVAFDESSYMRVLNSDNEIIAYYNRFENQSGSIKSMRVFDEYKNLKYVLVPIMTDAGFEIHLKDSNEQRGVLGLTARISGFSIRYLTEVDYFGKPFAFDYSTKVRIGKVKISETVLYEGEEVIANKTKVSAFSGINESPLQADKAFYEENKIDVANWALMIQLLNELSVEASRLNNSSNVRG